MHILYFRFALSIPCGITPNQVIGYIYNDLILHRILCFYISEEEEQVCPEEEPNKNNNSNYTESSKPNSTLNTDLSGQGSNPPDKGRETQFQAILQYCAYWYI